MILVLVVTAIASSAGPTVVGAHQRGFDIEQGQSARTLGSLPQRRDELGGLARSFQTMARNIRARGKVWRN